MALARFVQHCSRIWLRLAVSAFLLALFVAVRPGWAAEEVAYGQGLLWQIDGAASAPSYLLGTMHSADEEVAALPAPVAEAFAEAGSLSLEIIFTPDAQMKLVRAMALTDGRTLEGIIGGDLFDRVVTASRPYGMPDQVLMHLKPWAVLTLLSLPPSEVKRQAAGELPLDMRLQAEALERGLPLHGLETVDDQIGLFEGLSEPDQIAMLESTVELNDQVESLFEKMRQSYLARDTAAILNLMQSLQTGYDPVLVETFTEQMLDRRNVGMVESMQDRLADGRAFVAVGALHLPGENGILRLLEQRGYQVTRLY
jgi:uncharacterized protein YbaP (TraB family)